MGASTGRILGEDPDATIMIEDSGGDLLYSYVPIEGELTFDGEGTFHNEKYVLANVAGSRIEFGEDLDLADYAGDDVWRAEASGARLRFLKDHVSEWGTGLLGGFQVASGGIVNPDGVTVETSGHFDGFTSCGSCVLAESSGKFAWSSGYCE